MEGQDIEKEQARAKGGGALVISYRKLAVAAGALIVAAAVAVLVWQFAFAGSPARIPGIKLGYPNDWAQVSPATLKGAPPNAIAGLLRKDKKAVVLVIRNGPTKLDTATVTGLEEQLRSKYSDFRPLRSEMIRVQAGQALFLSYERTKQGKHGELDTITIIPAGHFSFVLDTTSPYGNSTIGRELQGIIGSAHVVQG